MLKLINVEFYKLMRRWLPYVSLALLIALLVISKIGPYSNYRNFVNHNPGVQVQPGTTTLTVTPTVTVSGGNQVNPPMVLVNVGQNELVLPWSMDGIMNTILGFGSILVIILAAQVVGSEYGWGTMRQTLIKGVSRRRFLLTKYLTLALTVIAGVAIALLVGLIIGMVTTRLVTGGISWSFITWGYLGNLANHVGRILLVLGVYLTLTTVICVLVRSAGTAMSVGMGFWFLDAIVSGLANSSSGIIKAIFRFGLSYNVQQFTSSFMGMNVQQIIRPLWQSSGILVAYGVIFVAAAFYLLPRQDLTA